MKPPVGGTTAREATATTRPPPPASIGGTTACAATYAVVRFNVNIESHSRRSVCARSPIAKPPTALTRTSMCRCLASNDCVSPAIAVSSATSQRSSTSRGRAAASTDAASEAFVLLVEQSQRDQMGGLELKRPVLLGRRRLLGLGTTVHADDLERLFLEVVRLLG